MLSLLAALVPAVAAGQRADTTMDSLTNLRAPASPAFALLGVAPTAVERPTTPRAVAVSLISATGTGTLFPRHYALEVAPYWLVSHPRLTFDQYQNPGFWQSLRQTWSVSLATADLTGLGVGTDSGTAVGFGTRAFVARGRPHPAVARRRASLQAILDSIVGTEDSALLRRLESERRTISLQIQELNRHHRLGWRIEVAAAGVMAFPENNARSGKLERIGLWLTSAYLLPSNIDLLAVGRFIRDERAVTALSLFDVGGRLVLQSRMLALSAEYVQRFVSTSGTGAKGGYRLSSTFEYRVTTGLSMTATLGTGPDEALTGKRRLISQIAVDFGFGPVALKR
ncbi:MAG: hypothetical protein ACREJ9_03535 [Candidatus Rokuibacteriota bacterium]